MELIDVDASLQAVSEDEPCGPNLEYDADFLALDAALQGKPEVQYGDTLTPGIPPEWKSIAANASDLLTRTRDLRVATTYARAALHLHGIIGFAAGLRLIEGMIETYWDSVHPQLDPSDDNDPMIRINTLAVLIEFGSVLRDVREVVLVRSRVHGLFSLRDFEITTGELQVAEGEKKSDLAVIVAAFKDADLIELQTLFQALVQARQSVVHIEELVTQRVGVSRALDLSQLAKLLARARYFVSEHMAMRDDAAGLTGDAVSDTGQMSASDASGQQATAVIKAVAGEITSRDDVVRMLDKLCDYYDRHEPSSPIPLLLKRAQRLVDKSFVEILKDVASDGLDQFYKVSGTSDDD
ncbi:MAG: type VI secretion system protein TssA [Aeromicrobium sp.]|nr:type VI secretion system protein TssA [Burkholderiales bacterium]